MNKQNVAQILKDTAAVPNVVRDSFKLNLFDFTTPGGFVIASTEEGVINEIIPVSKERRSWMTSALAQPWKLQISEPDQSIVSSRESGARIIPIGYGIADDNNKFLGYISVGIDIGKVTRKISTIVNKNLSFVILTKDFKEVTSLNIGEGDDNLEAIQMLNCLLLKMLNLLRLLKH